MKIQIIATETIVYRNSYELKELEEVAGKTLNEIGIDFRFEFPDKDAEEIEKMALRAGLHRAAQRARRLPADTGAAR